MSFQTADQVQREISEATRRSMTEYDEGEEIGGKNREGQLKAVHYKLDNTDESRKAKSHGKALSESFQRLRESLRAQARATFKR